VSWHEGGMKMLYGIDCLDDNSEKFDLSIRSMLSGFTAWVHAEPAFHGDGMLILSVWEQ
jgi:hypothetical protein